MINIIDNTPLIKIRSEQMVNVILQSWFRAISDIACSDDNASNNLKGHRGLYNLTEFRGAGLSRRRNGGQPLPRVNLSNGSKAA